MHYSCLSSSGAKSSSYLLMSFMVTSNSETDIFITIIILCALNLCLLGPVKLAILDVTLCEDVSWMHNVQV